MYASRNHEDPHMQTIMKAAHVTVPVRVAYDQWTQFEMFSEFMDNVNKVVQLDDVTMRWNTNIDGVEREFTTTITEQVPDMRIAWTTRRGETDHAGVITFHKISDEVTRLTVQMDVEPDGAIEKIGSFLGFDDRAVEQDLKNFASFIEERRTSTGSWRGTVQDGQVTEPDTTNVRTFV